VGVKGTLVEAKMCTFTLESTHFIFNQCPVYNHDGASANSHERDYSVQENAAEIIGRSCFRRIDLWIVFCVIYILYCGAGVAGSRTGEGPHLKILPAGVQEIRQESGSHCGESSHGESSHAESYECTAERPVANAFQK
jgi:hypothetical protein